MPPTIVLGQDPEYNLILKVQGQGYGYQFQAPPLKSRLENLAVMEEVD